METPNKCISNQTKPNCLVETGHYETQAFRTADNGKLGKGTLNLWTMWLGGMIRWRSKTFWESHTQNCIICHIPTIVGTLVFKKTSQCSNMCKLQWNLKTSCFHRAVQSGSVVFFCFLSFHFKESDVADLSCPVFVKRDCSVPCDCHFFAFALKIFFYFECFQNIT